MDEPQILVGRIVKPHGIRGEVAVAMHSDLPERFSPGAVLTTPDRTLTVRSSRPHQGRLLVRFHEVTDRTGAESLRGLALHAPPVDVSDSETYFAHELAGMRVCTADGADLGRVVDLIELPAAAGYELLEIEGPHGNRWLLPAVEDYVEVEVDDNGTERLVVTEPPDGLLDDVLGPGRPPDESDGGAQARDR